MKAVYNLQACRENDILESTARKRGSPVLDAVLKLNILHLIVTCCDCAAILALRREARGARPHATARPAVQRGAPFALAAAALLLAMGAPETRAPRLWLAGLVAGMVAACAGYLTGRAATLWRRSLSAPHHTLHHLLP